MSTSVAVPTAEYPRLRLKRHEERRLRAGHDWVYSNEIDTKTSPLSSFEPGATVIVEEHNGRALGVAAVNPHSLISARLYSRNPHQLLDRSLLVHRLNIALSLRERVFEQPFYRLVYGESDGLPGLIVDRFADVLVVQITTAGMERLKDDLMSALDKVLRPRVVVLRNDSAMRELEGLPSYVECAKGEPPELIRLQENGCQFQIAPQSGQKTGWYFDHRLNRLRAQGYVKGCRVLDVFSYVGAWGIQAAVSGATSVLCLDSSAPALDGVMRNAELNGVTDKLTTLEGDVFDALKALRSERERFDVVILDPPAFIKRKKDLKEGEIAYQRVNQMAMQLLSKDGILVSASCSYHLQRSRLREIIAAAARHVDRSTQILEQGHLGPDHPVHPAMPETDYLKCFTARITVR